MPIFDYRCTSCDRRFELLVRSATVPRCPHCGGGALERLVSLTAPAGQSQAMIARARAAAAQQGHLSHYSAAERGRRVR